MVEVVAMTVVSGRTIMVGFVWSTISSLLENALLHDDALNNMICRLVLVFCVSVRIEGEGICGVRVPRVFQFSGI